MYGCCIQGTILLILLKNSACVVTINSKVGFEAIMQGKPVVVLGKTFYRGRVYQLMLKIFRISKMQLTRHWIRALIIIRGIIS